MKQSIIVEGTYDKIKLSSIFDANIVTTDGFDIFKNTEKQEYIKKLAKNGGIIVLTDSDRAGFLIRNFIKNIVKEGQVSHAYIPDVEGKEKRKQKASKEGLLGVEGIEAEIIRKAVENAGCIIDNGEIKPLTSIHLYNDGFIGGEESRDKRVKLAKKLGVPARISAKALVSAINALGGIEIYEEIKGEII